MKKNCTARLACTSVRLSGSDGLSAVVPFASDVNVPVARLTAIVEPTAFPDVGRRGVEKYE